MRDKFVNICEAHRTDQPYIQEKRRSNMSAEDLEKYVAPPSFTFEKEFDHHAQIIDVRIIIFFF